MENEDDVVVVGAELLEVFLELGEIVVALLEDFAWLAVKTKLGQPEQGAYADNESQNGEGRPVTQQKAGIALRGLEAAPFFSSAWFVPQERTGVEPTSAILSTDL